MFKLCRRRKSANDVVAEKKTSHHDKLVVHFESTMATEEDGPDPLIEYISRYDIKISNPKELRRVLYEHAIDTIENRLMTQAGRISNEHLHQYASNLFLRNDATPTTRAVPADTCVLEIRIFKAESLAPKDVTGTSDPYCIVGVAETDLFTNFRSKKNVHHYNTSIRQETLTPEWNECIEIPLTREQVDSHFIHIQVWDYDDDESMAGAIQSLKDVKGIRGVGRFMKEVAQTVGKKDSSDDFMGFIAVPLKNIKLQGLERWFGLRSSSALQNVSGRVRVALSVSCPHLLLTESHHPGKTNRVINGKRIKNTSLTNEEILGGIVTLVVHGRHNIYKDLMKTDGEEGAAVDGWDGKLQSVDECLLLEMETQRRINEFSRVIIKWLVYCQEHLQLPDGIQMQRMTELLKALDAGNDAKDSAEKAFRPLLPVAGSEGKSPIFTFEKLPKSFDDFLRHCHKKIENHTELYPVKQNDTIIRLGEILLCLRTLRESKLYLTAKLVDTTMFGSGDIKEDISDSIRSGLVKLYEKLREEYEIVIVENDGNVTYSVPGMVKLVDAIHTALVHGRGYYHPVFKKVLKIDYISVALETICARLADDLINILPKVNKALMEEPDPIEEGSEKKSSAMFQLYLSLRDFAAYVGELFGDTHDENLQYKAIHENIGALKDYHEWFRPTILRWLQMSRGRAIKRLSAAVKLDKVERIDDIAKHSSSSVDAIGCLTSVVTFWHQIKWPDVLDGFLIATRITEDISNGVELYADLVHEKLKAVGFFDDEGQFDVTEELCLALNNLEKVKSFLKDILHEMKIESFLEKLEKVEEAPSKEKTLTSFKCLVKNADDGMKKKILEITSIVGSKLQPDISRYLSEYVKEVLKVIPKNLDGKSTSGRESDYDLHREEWESIGEEGIRPLMHYLTTNVITLKEWLCDVNFEILLKILWRVCLRCVREEILIKQRSQKPHLFSISKYILEEHLVGFFNAGGEGLNLETMFSVEEYKSVELEMKMRSASTTDLIRLFFDEVYKQQEAMEDAPYGTLNVFAWYKAARFLEIDVISAENLLPKDMNGLSDPFVQITLMPRQMFPAHPSKQTVEIKNTVNPVWVEQHFTFEVDHDIAAREGASVVFTIFDYDLIGRNDLEGECVLPLNILDGLSKDGSKDRNFRLTLTQPNETTSGVRRVETDGESQSSVEQPSNIIDLLKQRTSFDRNAAEFCRWRRKLQDAVKSDDIRLKLP